MSVSASSPSPSTSKNVKQHRCNICNMIFGSIDTLNAHNRMEHREARHSPAGVRPEM
jgi:hypothetical protein